MLSRDLLTIAEALERVDDGRNTDPLMLTRLCLSLCDCIERAAALEALAVAPAARLTKADLADGKVALLRRRA